MYGLPKSVCVVPVIPMSVVVLLPYVLFVFCMSEVISSFRSLSAGSQVFWITGGSQVDHRCFGFRGELGFLNYDDVCMCVLNKQFELLEFVSESVYVDLQYDEISLTFTAGSYVIFCVILHTMSSGKSPQLLYIFPFGMLCLSTIRMMFVKILLAVCMLVGMVV